jgi:hypothetical protein
MGGQMGFSRIKTVSTGSSDESKLLSQAESRSRLAVENKKATPAEATACRLDFAAWLALLPGPQRKIALTLAGGETTKVAAKQFSVTPG